MKIVRNFFHSRWTLRLGFVGLAVIATAAAALFGATIGTLGRPMLAVAGSAPAAAGISMTVAGQKQGVLKGGDAGGRMSVISYNYEVTSPRDAASGMATGKRMHKPITITKEWDAASPQLFAALTTNEMLPTVSFEFSRTASDGTNQVYYTITLTNAMVSSIHQFTPDPASGKGNVPLEEVSFTFQKIEMQNKLANTSAMDSWGGPM